MYVLICLLHSTSLNEIKSSCEGDLVEEILEQTFEIQLMGLLINSIKKKMDSFFYTLDHCS